MIYLGFVLPFWQTIYGLTSGASRTSAFVWAEEVAIRDPVSLHYLWLHYLCKGIANGNSRL